MLIQAKQINKIMLAYARMAGFSAGAANSSDVTAALTTALGTAGNNGVSVPVAVGSGTAQGVSVAANRNFVHVFKPGPLNDKYLASNGEEVYGKITHAGGVFTVSYFTAPGGVETAYTFPVATSIDIEFPYFFTFDNLPSSALVSVQERHVSPMAARRETAFAMEALTITTTNTIPNFANTPDGQIIMLVINGMTLVLGNGLSWNAGDDFVTVDSAVIGYDLTGDDRIQAIYTYDPNA